MHEYSIWVSFPLSRLNLFRFAGIPPHGMKSGERIRWISCFNTFLGYRISICFIGCQHERHPKVCQYSLILESITFVLYTSIILNITDIFRDRRETTVGQGDAKALETTQKDCPILRNSPSLPPPSSRSQKSCKTVVVMATPRKAESAG